jgi:hypothetical protein
MPDDGFDIVRAYDSIDDPTLKSESLDALGVTRPLINSRRTHPRPLRTTGMRSAAAPRAHPAAR